MHHHVSAMSADHKRERLRQMLEAGAESDVGRLPELLAPLMEKGGLNDAHIVASLTAGQDPGELVCRVTTDYATRQDQWLWGFVTAPSHRDRLRRVGVPLDDIQTMEPDAVGEQVRAEDVARRYDQYPPPSREYLQ